MIPRSIISGLCLACAALLGACTPDAPRPPAPQRPAPALDLSRFMGRWYVIAGTPHAAEAGYVGSYIEYAQRGDGGIDDFYFGRKRSFEKPLEKKQLAERAAPGDVLYVDAGYQYALLGHPDRQSAWVFARSPQIGEAQYHELLARFDQQGYDTARFQRVPQTIEQLGLPGFQTP